MNIEEIAFKDRTELAHLNGIDLLNIIEFLQKDRQQWINQFSKTHNESVEIQTKNKQLKEIIKENTILVKDEYGDYQECNINPLVMKQKYEKQVDNWNKLKEYINKRNETLYWTNTYDDILDKMQELEQGRDSDE